MINTYLNITVLAEWITFGAAAILLNRRTGLWRYFIVLLLFILIIETIGWFMAKQQRSNAMPFNILMLISNLFFIWFFSQTGFMKSVKRWLGFSAILFTLFWITNMLFIQGPAIYNSYSEAVADIVIVILCCYCLFAQVNDPNYINLLGDAYFWLATGLLFFCLGSALLYQFSDVLNKYRIQTQMDIGTYINYSLNLILYGCLICAFICKRRTIQ